jgi:hypothetical protein
VRGDEGYEVSCTYCGEPIDPEARTTWRRVLGWERAGMAPSRKGGRDVVQREGLQEWACPSCVDRLRRGVAAGQGSLL